MSISILQALGGLAPAIVDSLRVNLPTLQGEWATANATAASRLALPPELDPRAVIAAGGEQQLPAQAQSWIVVSTRLVGSVPMASGSLTTHTYEVSLTAYTRRQVRRAPDPSSSSLDPDTTVQTSATLAAMALATMAAQTVGRYLPTTLGVYHAQTTGSAPARGASAEVYAHTTTVRVTQRATTGASL
jgi:hypothetical protein